MDNDKFQDVLEYFERTKEEYMRRDMDNLVKGGLRQPWKVLDFNRVKKLWADYARAGFVRDVKGMQEVTDTVVDSIIKIAGNTELCGHTAYVDEVLLEDYGFKDWSDFSEKLLDKECNYIYFADNQNGQDRISDYALKPLYGFALDLLLAPPAEKQLLIVDRVFNIIHMRSDIAAWFLPKGSEDLDELKELEIK